MAGRCRTACRDKARPSDLRAGFTLLELMIVLSVMLIAFLAMSQSVVTSMRMTADNRENAWATDGARAMLEVLGGFEDFSELFATYNANPLDDPGGPGTAPGSGFAVAGLRAIDGDPDGLVGEIVFPTMGNELREDLLDPELGMPRDLNGDGLTDAVDHSGDYQLLPVLVRVQWTGAGLERTHEVRTLIADR